VSKPKLRQWWIRLPLAPESKANSRKPMKRGRYIRWELSDKAKAFVNESIARIKTKGKPSPFEPDDRIAMVCTVRYPDFRHDLDCELVCDVLQTAGIIHNDRQLRAKWLFADDQTKGPPYTRVAHCAIGTVQEKQIREKCDG
jgi:hypothetical protein